MTYGEKLDTLKQDVIRKLTEHLKAEELLFSQPTSPVDISFVEARNQTYSDWQKAQNAYHDFLGLLINVGSLDQEMQPSQRQAN